MAYETATLELDLIQGAMETLQQERDQVEADLAAIETNLASRGLTSQPITVN